MKQLQLVGNKGSDSKFYDKAFKQALKFASEKEVPRPVLYGVYHREDGALVATDGMKLIIIENAHDRKDGVIINKKGGQQEGRYPDVSKVVVMAKEDVSIKKIDVQEWLNATEALLALAQKKAKGIKIDIKMSKGCPVEFSCVNPEMGNGKWSLKEVSDDDMEISVQGLYLQCALKSLKTLGHMHADIHFSKDQRAPFKIVFDGGVCVIAPILNKR